MTRVLSLKPYILSHDKHGQLDLQTSRCKSPPTTTMMSSLGSDNRWLNAPPHCPSLSSLNRAARGILSNKSDHVTSPPKTLQRIPDSPGVKGHAEIQSRLTSRVPFSMRPPLSTLYSSLPVPPTVLCS